MGQIATRPWGERSFYVHDPFGNPLCFVDAGSLFTGPPASDRQAFGLPGNSGSRGRLSAPFSVHSA